MPQREQLAIIGASDTQMHFTSERWGLLTFFPAKSDLFKDTCRHCLLLNQDECNDAPCYARHRTDGQNGYFSIHDMPDWAKKNKTDAQ